MELVISSNFMLLSNIWSIYHYLPYNDIEKVLSTLYFMNYICSTLFWINPNEHNIIHKIDGIIAKISFLLFSIYGIIIQKNLLFFIYTILSLYFFYNSAYFSKIKWCSNDHIYNHFMFHIFISIGTTYIFKKE